MLRRSDSCLGGYIHVVEVRFMLRRLDSCWGG